MEKTEALACQWFIRMFGPLTVEHAGRPQRFNGSRKALALLAYLVRHDQPVERRQLASLLWSETTDARGRRNLTRELAQLATHLPDCLQADFHAVQWAPDALVQVDVTLAQTLLTGGTMSAQSAATVATARLDPVVLGQIAELYRGDFLAGWYLDDCPEFETWLTCEREYWRRQMVAVWNTLIAYHAKQGAYEHAEPYARRWVALEPWDEDAHHALIDVLARSGKRNAALMQYEMCRRTLAAELGVEPAEKIVALSKQIRSGGLDETSKRETRPAPRSTPSIGMTSRTSIACMGGRRK